MNKKIFLSIVLTFSLAYTFSVTAMLSKPKYTQEDVSHTRTELVKQKALDAKLLQECKNETLNFNNISSLIGQGADVNVKDFLGGTPLHYACGRNHIAAAELLIKNDAIVNAQSADGDTPLHVASEEGHIESVKYLFENGADVNSTNNNGVTPLHKACEFGHFNVITFLVQNGAHINAKDKNLTTALILACQPGFSKTVDFLIKNGADVHARNYRNATPLHFACIANDIDIMKILIKNDADINAITTGGWSPLHVTALNDNAQACKLLLDLHANTNLVTVDGMSALDVAYDTKHTDIIKLFKKYDIQTNAEKQAYDNMLAFFKELNQEEISKSNIHKKTLPPEPKQEIIGETVEPLIDKPIEPISSSSPIIITPLAPISTTEITAPTTPSMKKKPAIKVSNIPSQAKLPVSHNDEYQILIGEDLRWPKSLNENQKLLIKGNLKKLKNWPHHSLDIKKLKHNKDMFRLRVGSYRIIFSADTIRHQIKIHKIGLRKKIYMEL